MGRTKQISNLDQAVAALAGGPWYRRIEVARRLDVTPAAILAIAQSKLHPELGPSAVFTFEGKEVHLYTEDDVRALRKHFTRETRGSGRPRIWTLKQSADRRRRLDLARYYAREAANCRERGDLDRAEACEKTHRDIRKKLDDQLEAKKAVRVGRG